MMEVSTIRHEEVIRDGDMFPCLPLEDSANSWWADMEISSNGFLALPFCRHSKNNRDVGVCQFAVSMLYSMYSCWVSIISPRILYVFFCGSRMNMTRRNTISSMTIMGAMQMRRHNLLVPVFPCCSVGTNIFPSAIKIAIPITQCTKPGPTAKWTITTMLTHLYQAPQFLTPLSLRGTFGSIFTGSRTIFTPIGVRWLNTIRRSAMATQSGNLAATLLGVVTQRRTITTCRVPSCVRVGAISTMASKWHNNLLMVARLLWGVRRQSGAGVSCGS